METKVFIHCSRPKYEKGQANYFKYYLLMKLPGHTEYTQCEISEFDYFRFQSFGIPEEKNY